MLYDMTSAAIEDDSIIGDMDELLRLDISPSCPSCGYPGLDYDKELRAYLHDWCGYYSEQEQDDSDDDPDDPFGWLD